MTAADRPQRRPRRGLRPLAARPTTRPCCRIVTSANVACGFHAGDPPTMRRVCDAAAERGVRDRRPGVLPRPGRLRPPGHGRAADELAAEVAYQIGALEVFARAAGRPRRVRQAARRALQPRGARPGAGRRRRRRACGSPTPALPVLGLPGSALHDGRRRAGCPWSTRRSPTAPTPRTARWSPRREPGAVITDADAGRRRARADGQRRRR